MSSRRLLLLKFFIPVLAAALCLAVLEIAVRLVSRTDADGNCRFRETWLKPNHLPVHRVEAQVAEYFHSEKSGLIYDAALGWTQRPNIANHNAAGIITTEKTPALAPGEPLRIALFGDSFTQGDSQFGWWRVLEERLNAAGKSAEVLNFGVGGYGMDQAFLRWKIEGAASRPRVVVFGFFADDCYRNVNLLRLVRDPGSGIPFMKPRFVLEGDGLRLVNSPTPAPEEIPEILQAFASWPLARFETFFSPLAGRFNGWRHSRLLALGEAKFERVREAAQAEEFFRIDREPAQLALRILREMRRDVEAQGARFFVVHLPGQSDLQMLRKSGRLPYAELFEELLREQVVIHPEAEMLAAARGKEVREFYNDAHYKPEFNAIVGKAVADFLRGPDWSK